MDVIRFATQEVIFRFPHEHHFVEGQGGVVDVERTDFTLHPHLRARSPAVAKNICGKFMTFLEGFVPHRGVSNNRPVSCFGRHHDMYHLHGTVTVHRGVAFFKGCAGLPGVRAIAEDLFLDTPRCEVHMGVFKACLGRRVCTDHGCFLENRVAARFRGLRVRHRFVDSTQAVKLRIDRFDAAEFPYLEGQLTPTSVDLSVTNTGVLMLRFSWSKCAWSEEAEAAVLRFCDWAAEQLRACC